MNRTNIWSSLAQSPWLFQIINGQVQSMSHKQHLLLMERSTITVFHYRTHVCMRTSPTEHLIRKSTVITIITVWKIEQSMDRRWSNPVEQAHTQEATILIGHQQRLEF